ncbi:MAG TPA: arginine--tRNA ligase [Allosphingosinicella sp.]
MNELARRNALRRREVEAFRDEAIAAHRKKALPRLADYPLPRLKARIADALSKRWGEGRLEPQIETIDRAQFGGDLVVKLPQLLRDGGPKGFIANHLPWIVETLEGPDFADAVVRVETRGMYVNLTLSDRWLLDGAQKVADLGDRFGLGDAQAARTFLVDYSSPNVAKMLHAGHIRSTIIGHVLSNLHEGCGALVYRVNHINDFGGFGFTLEGWRRFEPHFPVDMAPNARLLEIYRIRRVMEKSAATGTWPEEAEEAALVARYFPGAGNGAALKAAWADFVAASDARFAALEAGAGEEVDLWALMVEWSLADFDLFYDALNLRIDLVLGESFYFEAGDRLIDDSLANGRALLYTSERADADIAALDALDLQPAEREKRAEAIAKDIGAVVVPLEGGERYVVRRADGRSIYSTRDLGAIEVRRRLLDPTDFSYVVGQEQRVHFDRLFKAAEALGLAEVGHPLFHHVWFGFYVDAGTGKKLSSRDSVANVNQLLARSIDYFRARTAERGDQNAEEVAEAAKQLAVGSLVFNDLKQDIKGSVDIDTTDLEATIAGFERAGGAYMVYTACRARSILRKYGAEPDRAETIAQFEIDAQEAALLLRLQQIPERVAAAAEQRNPTLLIRHLLDTASVYNSYYMRAPVLTDAGANKARLVITRAVNVALVNSLRLCHVECPPKI